MALIICLVSAHSMLESNQRNKACPERRLQGLGLSMHAPSSRGVDLRVCKAHLERAVLW